MSTVVIIGFALAATLGSALALHHLYLRLDRPGGCTSSLRVAAGAARGLSGSFRTGYIGPEMDQLWWRRIAGAGPGIRFPKSSLRLAESRRPIGREHLQIPPHFVIVVVDLIDGTRLELAVPHRRLRELLA